MRILIAAKFVHTGPNTIGGVQSWVKTVAAELTRIGHDVSLWQPGFKAPAGRFDFGIVSNWMHTEAAARGCDRVLVVSHGIIPDERPPSSGVPLAFTSEEVRENWGLDGRVIRQPIDLDFWRLSTVRDLNLVRYSYRRGMTWLRSVVEQLGFYYSHEFDLAHDEARHVLAGAACVLATGRAALEAMATGAPVVIIDHRSAYQGPLMDLDIEGAMTRNYSGRGGILPTPESVREAIKAAIARGSMREHVAKHHDARNIVQELLA